jgi:hypothetical protein
MKVEDLKQGYIAFGGKGRCLDRYSPYLQITRQGIYVAPRH